MTSRSKQKIKFECTLAFDRQRATSVILHFLIVPRLCSNIHKKKIGWYVGYISSQIFLSLPRIQPS